MVIILSVPSLLFQSTLPYGSDIHRIITSNGMKNFNPRSLTGATHDCICRYETYQYFNPRSLTGATFMVSYFSYSSLISIHAPLRERLSVSYRSLKFIDISIHAPLRERLCPANLWNMLKIFQSTLPYGSDIWL